MDRAAGLIAEDGAKRGVAYLWVVGSIGYITSQLANCLSWNVHQKPTIELGKEVFGEPTDST